MIFERVCEHKFKTTNEYIETHSESSIIDVSNWGYHVILKTSEQSTFINLFKEVRGFEFRYDINDNLIYIKGVEKDIYDFIELVKEEHETFNCETTKLQVGLAYDPDCLECNNELRLFNRDIKCITFSDKRSKAMLSQEASEKKLKGHAEEELLANKIGGKVITGHTKPDVKSKSEKLLISVKGFVQKYQIFLYSKRRFIESDDFSELAPYFIKCISSFPDNRNEYKIDKDIYKEKLRRSVGELTEKINDGNLEYFLDGAFFNDEANAICLKDNKDCFYFYEPYEFLKYLSEIVRVTKSKGSKVFAAGGQKVVFQAPLGKDDSYVTIGEIEIRHDPANYGGLKFWMCGPKERNSLLRLLRKKITKEEEINDGIILCGKSLGFKEELMFDNKKQEETY